MAIKKAIVITNGQLEQLQPGDRLDLNNSVTKTNNSGIAMIVGDVVFVSGVNADLAQANQQNSSRVAGVVVTGGADASPVDIQTEGIVTLTTTEWDTAWGTVGGLVPGTDYFLSESSAGDGTPTAPTAAGEFVALVGHALSDTELELRIQQPIKL